MSPNSRPFFFFFLQEKLKELHISVQDDIDRLLPKPPSNSTPQQLHLSTTGTPGELFITWVVPEAGDVCTDSHASIGAATFPAAWTRYEAGVAGWAGAIYTSRLTGLAPGAPVAYSVHSCGSTTGPIAITAPKANGPQAETLVAVMADMGTVIPLGFATAAQIEKDHAKEPFDLFVLAGDISACPPCCAAQPSPMPVLRGPSRARAHAHTHTSPPFPARLRHCGPPQE